MRAYYRDALCDGAQMKVYFDRDYFPGYGWLFVDDKGFANIGLGCLLLISMVFTAGITALGHYIDNHTPYSQFALTAING